MTKLRSYSLVKTIFLALIITVFTGVTSAYAAESLPKIQRLNLEYAIVREGDTQTIDIFTNYAGKVQYKVWIVNRKNNIWQDITNGYTAAQDGKKVFTVTTPELKEGEYGISVWVKRAGATPANTKGYDNFLGDMMLCLKDNGQGPNVKLSSIQNNYSVGGNIEVKKEEGKQYSYSYSIDDLIQGKTLVSFTPYKDSFSWKASKDGLYLLKVKIKSIEKIAVPKVKEDKDDEKSKLDIKPQEKDGQVIEEKAAVENQDKVNVEDKNNISAASDKNSVEGESKKDENGIVDNKDENGIVDNKEISNDKTIDDKVVGDEKINNEEVANNKIADDGKIDEVSTTDDAALEEDKEDISNDTQNLDVNSEEDKEEIEYKEVEKITEVKKIILVGDPDKVKEPTSSTGSTAPSVSSLVVGNAGETQRIYIKAQPSASSKNVGYFYGSTVGVKILKTVGDFYYIEATDYNSLKPVKGYVYKSQLKTIKPRTDYSIKVDLSEQKVYIFKEGKLYKSFECSTGLDSTPTPTGTYVIGDRGPYFYTGTGNSVICYNWIRWNNNFLFHSTLHTRSGQEIASEAKKLGSKASHGCIRVAVPNIQWMYKYIPKGTLVIIQN
ncbi:L,D-transpeptidase [Clostridium colicanis]|uniref:Putative L,D-transpeptidase YciB n=1 Tax=Clostridium colicanis DSM 13634 TaxID=1121305 RepID=A0A151APY3_9CLOT|nr:L,D-transpeptidase [Clostridium colicanis]KYH29701.1 putative L,D-transpeptidase YciB precursor [Clostridium colicanis DSM 13634]